MTASRDAAAGPTGPGSLEARLVFIYSSPARVGPLVQNLSGAGHQVIACPLSALLGEWLRRLEPDLILLDPPEDEAEMLASCEAVHALTEQPIAVLSERRDEQLLVRTLASGIDEFLVQPMGESELTARIDALLRSVKRHSSSNGIQRIGGLLLSPEEHRAVLHGRDVSLSPIEFRLLVCLASAPGKVMTHRVLMVKGWGAEYVDSRHYLRLYIRYLREKLEDDPANPKLIVSHWGVGYSLQPPQPRDATQGTEPGREQHRSS